MTEPADRRPFLQLVEAAASARSRSMTIEQRLSAVERRNADLLVRVQELTFQVKRLRQQLARNDRRDGGETA